MMGNYEKYIVCRRCGYKEQLYPYRADYFYKGLEQLKYPEIRYAWCKTCKKISPIQIGIDIASVRLKINELTLELNRANGKLLKTRIIKEKIRELEKEIHLFQSLCYLTNNESTLTSCIECGSVNVIFRDIENQLWYCPKCNLGQLSICVEEKDCFIKRRKKYITPVKFSDVINSTFSIVDCISYKILMCAFDIIHNVGLYYQSLENKGLLLSVSKNSSLIDRIAIILSLINFNVKELEIDDIVFSLTQIMILNGICGENHKEFVIDKLKNRFRLFSDELEIEMNCTSFIPTILVYAIRHPNEDLNTQINCMSPVEAIEEWKIISDTTIAYFGSEYNVFFLKIRI